MKTLLLLAFSALTALGQTWYGQKGDVDLQLTFSTPNQANLIVGNDGESLVTLPFSYNLAPYNWGYSISGGDAVVESGNSESFLLYTWSTGGVPKILIDGIDLELQEYPFPDDDPDGPPPILGGGFDCEPSIPEPSTTLLGSMASLCLIRRKRA